jgi:LacI family fructose operon transcriptional repressor
MASIRDVADACGLSTATVSRVLAGKDHVREQVRQRVLEAVARLGYRPNRVARSLRSNRSTTIGLVVADIQNPYFTRICRAVEDTALRCGFAIFLCNTDEDPEKEELYLRHLVDENVAGIIFAPTGKAVRDFSKMKDLGMPLVVIDRPIDKGLADSVVIDNVEAAFELTGHLISHHRTRIAGIFGARSATGRERWKGFSLALQKHGLSEEKEIVLSVPPREEEGYKAVQQMLARAVPPDAILTSNGLLAIGAYRALMEAGNRCPEEISFASFDDAAWSSLVHPAVTVIEQPTYEIGSSAAELLLQRIADPKRSIRQVALKHHLLIRNSCGCLP